MKHLKWVIGWLAFLTLGLLFSVASTTAQAKAINYQALKYQTNQTSMASGYFVKPASVKVVHHKYVVTMRIKTAKKLSTDPVKVLSINGGAPKNVRRVKDHAGNTNLYYSFTTTNLKQRITAKLAINVPMLYHAKHLISFKFNTKGLPSLKGKAVVTAATVKVTGTTAVNKSQRITGNKRSKSSRPKDRQVKQLDQRKSASKQAVSSQPSTIHSSSASSQTTPATKTKQPSANTQKIAAVKKDHSQVTSRGPLLIAGVVVIIAVVVGGSLMVMKKQE
ncbi:NEAT domain-containing protein [Secundilactobacillus silagei]|uniref:Cell surface protein n=1 Tax=Secundilactobacillus silagei JCM 19001 TaxID=1302250 RepID=A0A1Z5IHK7_9LACO|nr:NEAT domain-containing protein [Secundilactobacillus silagei]TDG72452.1 hypothetical protein C5L25_001828 [Secundilactobacillus silagei JCM 19001]GAX01255.1 cell surface protein [Secundilactobacillus silagei JCM 19001]